MYTEKQLDDNEQIIVRCNRCFLLRNSHTGGTLWCFHCVWKSLVFSLVYWWFYMLYFANKYFRVCRCKSANKIAVSLFCFFRNLISFSHIRYFIKLQKSPLAYKIGILALAVVFSFASAVLKYIARCIYVIYVINVTT